MKAARTVWNGGKGGDYFKALPIVIKTEIPTEIWYNKLTTTKNSNTEEFLMNIITQEARKRQAVVKLANVLQAGYTVSVCRA